ncbi:MAG: metallophosphoesterase [Alphaproteobacteria bacterium]|nr:metallophosphoesterase [Alphaproteobacteria bacterium]
MRWFAALALLAASAAQADDNTILHYWVQLGAGGAQQARAVMSGDGCPILATFKDYNGDGRVDVPMTPRAAKSADFPLVCEGTVPKDVNHAWLVMTTAEGDGRQMVMNYESRKRSRAILDMDQAVPLMRSDPERILVIGDTGCRLKGSLVQPCNDPSAWPFEALSKGAAKLWPDLIIHVGDYLYRETPCPDGNAGCAGSPYGDGWATWDADFFKPGDALLRAAPIVLVRGNHEDCARSGPGYLRLIGSGAYDATAPCTEHEAAYSIPLEAENLVVMDNASAQDTSITPGTLPVYQDEFAAMDKEPAPSWLLMHRPIWGAVKGPLGIPVGGNTTMIAALNGRPVPKPVALILAGHIHSFEAINYKSRSPPMLLAGHGGDLLDDTPADLDGAVLSGIKVKDGLSVPGFGFLLMTREGKTWHVGVFDSQARLMRECVFAGGRLDCPEAKKAE